MLAPTQKSASPPRIYARSRRYTLYQGDACASLQSLDRETCDLIFADPPYFLSNGGFTCQSGKRAPVKKGDWDASRGTEHDYAFTLEWLQACQRVLKPSGSIWVSGTQHVIFSIGFAMQQLGYKLLNTISWYKPNAAPNLACRFFTHSTEILIWASLAGRGKLKHTFNYAAMKTANGGKQMRDVWALPKPGEEELSADAHGRVWTIVTPQAAEKAHGKHPTQKPLALLRRIVEASTRDGAVVCDPFCGSGTTGVAAISRGRRFVGIDLNANYLDLTKKRLEAVNLRHGAG